MKKALKIFLAVVLIVSALISVFASLCALASAGSEIYGIVSIVQHSYLSFFAILSIVISSASLFLSLILSLLFIVITIGCFVSVLYIFIGSSDNRLSKIEMVINEAYATSQDEIPQEITIEEGKIENPQDAKEDDYE